MVNSDLEGYTPPAQAGASAKAAATAFTGLTGTALKLSENPNDRTFTITMGVPDSNTGDMQTMAEPVTETVTLYDDGEGGTLSASGSISLDIALDTGFDYDWLGGGLQAFKFIVVLDAEQSVELTASC